MDDNERVRLAKEVIARLDAGTIVPETGRYLGYRHEGDSPDTCRVCAVAGLAVACCGADELRRRDPIDGDSYATADMLAACLDGIFSKPQLGLIEAAYEMDSAAPLSLAVSDRVQARKATEALTGKPAHVRLRAIMQNIIDNNGEFRP